MKEFLKMMRQYASPYKGYLAVAVFLNILSAIFNIFSFTVLVPLLNILFKVNTDGNPRFLMMLSDQRIFLEHGIPAVMFTSGITLHNNKPTDNAASLDYDVLKDRIRLIFYWLDKVL